jgi:hypothetical protein
MEETDKRGREIQDRRAERGEIGDGCCVRERKVVALARKGADLNVVVIDRKSASPYRRDSKRIECREFPIVRNGDLRRRHQPGIDCYWKEK